jgi:hypothetical protein
MHKSLQSTYSIQFNKRKQLEGYNCNNVPKRTKLNAERQGDYRKCKAQENKAPQASNSRAACMRKYRKKLRVEKYICNNEPKLTENANLRKKLRKIKHHKHLHQLIRHQLQSYSTIIIKRINSFKRILLIIHLVMTATYVTDYGI